MGRHAGRVFAGNSHALCALLLDMRETFISNMKMSDGKAGVGVRCPDLSWKRLHARYSLLKSVLFGVFFLSCQGAVAPSTAKAATYVRVYYGGRPYYGYPYVYLVFLFTVLFSIFCYSLELERLGRALVERKDRS